MKRLQKTAGVLLALCLSLTLFACDLVPEEEVTTTAPAVTALDPSATEEGKAAEYLTRLVLDLNSAESYKVETRYSLDRIESDHQLVQQYADDAKSYITDTLNKTDDPATAESAPFLITGFSAGDFTTLKTEEATAVRLREKIDEMKAARDAGTRADLAGVSDDAIAQLAAEELQADGATWAENDKYYEIRGEAADLSAYIKADDEAALTAELAKAEDYAAASYQVNSRSYTLYAKADKATDRLLELTVTEKTDGSAVLTGQGEFAGEGSANVTFTLIKTVTVNGIVYPSAPETNAATDAATDTFTEAPALGVPTVTEAPALDVPEATTIVITETTAVG
ncbi:MAG: hypothetical protein LBR73_00595 [Oscillospiraceae bacterium]|jgi:hypothetical protein|nr:hypothetical protein [Oscillospiraceae bacterium]